MKNIIKTSLLVLLTAPMLVGCGENKGAGLQQIAKQAVAQVGVAYSEYAQSGGISLAGGKLTTEFTIGNHVFEFDYRATTTTAYKYQYLTVANGKMSVKIPTFKDLDPSGKNSVTYAAYQLNAKVYYKGVVEGQTEDYANLIGERVAKHTWNIRINAEEVEPVWAPIKEARLKSNGDTVVTSGYVAAIMNPKDDSEYLNGVWIADGDAGLMLYGSTLTAYFTSLKIGDLVMVIGTASPYNGLFEVKPTTLSVVDSAPQEVAKPNFKEITANDIDNFTSANCSDPVTIKDVTIDTDPDSMTVKSSTAISIGVSFGGKSMLYYVNKHTNLAQRQELVNLLKANKGKKATLKAVMGYNSGTFQFSATVLTQGGSLTDNFIF